MGALVICICSYDPEFCRTTQNPQPISVRISETEFNSKYYKVRTGKVLVLNNKEFRVPGVELADRKGSDVDASSISQRFVELGFEQRINNSVQ